ncbi:unnamed protein product [Adineta ricciae]|uniref:Uncharacterized protein n=1 Tax=Adineta ricciae TaxID=249248 RepID=A0A814QX77_ADIRI|nr:unnamed protein product [Adineta ricciae]
MSTFLIFILILDNIGCICNFVTFSVKQLRENSCGRYFLVSSLFNFVQTRFTWVLPCIATDFLVLASLDRCLSTAQRLQLLRSFSQIKIALRKTSIPILINSLASTHQLIFYELRPKYYAAAGVYSYFLSIYSIVWISLVPQMSMLLFGVMTYNNIRKGRQCLNQQTDSHLIRMMLVQVMCSSILLNIRTAYYSYTVITTNYVKDDYRAAVEKLVLQMTSFFFCLNFCKSSFVNILSSTLFRKIFKE